jgi:hypothetical protein
VTHWTRSMTELIGVAVAFSLIGLGFFIFFHTVTRR